MFTFNREVDNKTYASEVDEKNRASESFQKFVEKVHSGAIVVMGREKPSEKPATLKLTIAAASTISVVLVYEERLLQKTHGIDYEIHAILQVSILTLN